MRRRCATAALAAVLFSAACAVDGPRTGPRDGCSGADDDPVDCEPVSLAGADEACWRLVQCEAIPVANPESDPGCCFDWAACVNHIESLPDEQFELALACIEASACDDLKPEQGGGPRCVEPL